MGQGSRWASVIYPPWKSQNGSKVIMGCCCLPPDRVKLAVNSKKETNSSVKMGKGSRWTSVIYPLKESTWGCCCLPPDRVKLIVNKNSKKETNSRVKLGKESKWAKGQDGFLFCSLPPDRVKLAVNSKKIKGPIEPTHGSTCSDVRKLQSMDVLKLSNSLSF